MPAGRQPIRLRSSISVLDQWPGLGSLFFFFLEHWGGEVKVAAVGFEFWTVWQQPAINIETIKSQPLIESGEFFSFFFFHNYLWICVWVECLRDCLMLLVLHINKSQHGPISFKNDTKSTLLLQFFLNTNIVLNLILPTSNFFLCS